MSIESVLAGVEAWPLSINIAESGWLFPTIETLHVLSLVLVVGAIIQLDLRLLGVASRQRGVMQLSEETLPWVWIAFVVAVITGSLMFISSATRYWGLLPFRIKMVLLVLAGLNMAIFHFTAYRVVHDWNDRIPTPISARVAGALSLTFWIAVVFFGRWIGFA
jgi:hypothetical protein